MNSELRELAVHKNFFQVDTRNMEIEQREITLEKAKSILKNIVSTDESVIKSENDLVLEDCDDLTIKKALFSVGEYIIENNSQVRKRVVSKNIPEGKLIFAVDSMSDRFRQISLTMYDNKTNFLVKMYIPLSDNVVDDKFFGFFDYRDDKLAHIKQFDLGISIQRIRTTWRGLRWMAANMLNWDKERILPEDLPKIMENKNLLE